MLSYQIYPGSRAATRSGHELCRQRKSPAVKRGSVSGLTVGKSKLCCGFELLTVVEFDAGDLRAPIELCSHHVVLGDVPERAAVGRVQAHRAVVSPAVLGVHLGTGALHNLYLGSKGAQRIADRAAGYL